MRYALGGHAMTQSQPDARHLAEQALQAQAQGDTAAADALFARAQALDPDAVAAVLREHDAAHEPDARDQRTFDADRPAQHAG
jgi:hypothetical protein